MGLVTRARSIGALVALSSIVLLTGCIAHLAPAPGAVAVPGPGAGAVTRGHGVQVSARVHAWRAAPSTLESIVTPVFVTIENNGTVAIRVRRDDFVLVTADGTRIVPRSPYDIGGVATEQAPAGLAYPRVSVGVGLGVSRGGRLRYGFGDPFWYDDYYYPMTVIVALPTADMVQMALAERVLQPGERAEGFLYFERVDRKAKRIDFTMQIVDASSGAQLGTVAIPFVVD